MEWNIIVEWFYGVLERSYGVEYCSGVESNFEVSKILITPGPAESIYLAFSNIWTGLF